MKARIYIYKWICINLQYHNYHLFRCTDGECAGNGLGETCIWSGDCNYGLFCDKGKCEPVVSYGDKCFFNEACDRDSLCYFKDPTLPYGKYLKL